MRWVTDVFGRGSRVARARRLRLGGWHVNHALDVVDAEGGTHRLVLRRWARPGWEVADPDYTVKREIRVLKLLSSMHIPAPGMVAADPDGASCDVPAILLTRLTGHPPRPEDTAADGFCRQLAETLARTTTSTPPQKPSLTPTGSTTTAPGRTRHPGSGHLRLGAGDRSCARGTPTDHHDADPSRLPPGEHPVVPAAPHRGCGLDPGLLGSTRARPWPHALEPRRRPRPSYRRSVFGLLPSNDRNRL